ncbi:MAG: fumarate hydratase C-terminal domain-containing protein [Polyangiaceae bacterium]
MVNSARHRAPGSRARRLRRRDMPQYLKDYMVYYAGPAKTPAGFRDRIVRAPPPPATWTYVDLFMANGSSFVMLAGSTHRS